MPTQRKNSGLALLFALAVWSGFVSAIVAWATVSAYVNGEVGP